MAYLPTLHEESEILHQVAQGNERAFSILFHHYHQRLAVHIYRITRSEELAEEVVQDVFLKIWLNRELLAGIENFPVYLYVISKNAALNCLKKVAAEHAKVTDLEHIPEPSSMNEPGEEEYRYMLIDAAIDRLPAQQKQVYLLSRHERLTYAEIADRMGLSKETVKKYLQLATESISTYVRKQLLMSLPAIIQIFFLK